MGYDKSELELFLQGYLEAAAFADAPEGFTDLDFNAKSIKSARKDCASFLSMDSPLGKFKIYDHVGDNLIEAGRNFWYTRQGHGTGFWDSPEVWGEDISKALTTVAKTFSEGIGIEVKRARLTFY